MKGTLALLGGKKARPKPFPPYPVIGPREKKAVLEVLREGRFSTFIAAPGEHFLGGKRIRQFEKEFADYHGVRHAVAFNSATAALHAAVVGVGVQPGDEVVTTPYTFTSTATSVLMHNAIPLFADVDPSTFCLDPVSVRARLTARTRALIPVHLFGHPAPMDEILALAREKGLRVIEDCAQAPGALYRGKKVGTLGDCGVFSFQETKNMMTGEGGMLITDDPAIAEAAQLLRNHGEAVAESMTQRTYASRILGWNYRMTEFEAALGRAQLGQLDGWNARRRALADALTRSLKEIPGITPPRVAEDCEHAYYVYPFLYNEEETGLPRALFAEALRAEGVPIGAGYVKPLYMSPLYQERNVFAFQQFPNAGSYEKGLCPVTERLHFKEMVIVPVCRPPATVRDMEDIGRAVRKVLDGREDLLRWDAAGRKTP